MYLLYLFMINLCNILLPKDIPKTIPADIGKTIKPIPVIDRNIEVDVAAMITMLIQILILCLKFYKFYISFLIYGFCLLKYVIISLMLLIWLLKLLTSFIFFL